MYNIFNYIIYILHMYTYITHSYIIYICYICTLIYIYKHIIDSYTIYMYFTYVYVIYNTPIHNIYITYIYIHYTHTHIPAGGWTAGAITGIPTPKDSLHQSHVSFLGGGASRHHGERLRTPLQPPGIHHGECGTEGFQGGPQ